MDWRGPLIVVLTLFAIPVTAGVSVWLGKLTSYWLSPVYAVAIVIVLLLAFYLYVMSLGLSRR